MKQYRIQYHDKRWGWVNFCIKSVNINEALDWVKNNIQEKGVAVSYIGE